MTTTHRLAVIPGDGIGKEVVPEGLKVLDAAATAFGFAIDYEQFDYACAEYYTDTGAMLPDGWFDELSRFDAIFFGAVGWPDVVPDHISLWGSLLQFRRHFDQYVNLRPVKLMPGCEVRSPAEHLATSTSSSSGRTPRASTRVSAAGCSRARTARRWCKRR